MSTTGKQLLVWVCVVLVAAWVLYLARSALAPFVVSLIVSLLVHPIIQKLRRRGWNKAFAIFTVLFVFFGLASVAAVVVVPKAGTQVAALVQQIDSLSTQLLSLNDLESKLEEHADELYLLGLPSTVEGWRAAEADTVLIPGRPNVSESLQQNQVRLIEMGLPATFESWREKLDENEEVAARLSEQTSGIDKFLEQNKDTLEHLGLPTSKGELKRQFFDPYEERISETMSQTLAGLLNFTLKFATKLIPMLFVPLISFFILIDADRYRNGVLNFIPTSIRNEAIKILNDISKVLANYLRGMSLVVLCYGLFASVLLSLLGVPYSILIGALMGFLGVIPTLGMLFSYIVLFIVIGLTGANGNWLFTMNNTWIFSLAIVGITAVIMTVWDQIAYPKLVGGAVGLPPAAGLLVMFCGGAVFGFFGVLIAFPIAGAVKVVLDRVLAYTNGGTEALT